MLTPEALSALFAPLKLKVAPDDRRSFDVSQIHHEARHQLALSPEGSAFERWAESKWNGNTALAASIASRECLGSRGNIDPAATS